MATISDAKEIMITNVSATEITSVTPFRQGNGRCPLYRIAVHLHYTNLTKK
jgi:fido (protein-threonine AMPylation protein)